MLDSCQMPPKQSEAFHTFLRPFFPNLKHNFITYHSYKGSSCPDWIFEIHQLWQSGFSMVYSNCCCSCSFESEIIEIGQSSHKMYSNNILNVQESKTILNACTKKSGNLLKAPCIYIYIYIYARPGRDRRPIFKRCLTSWTQSFPSPKLVGIASLKNPVRPITQPYLEREQLHSYLSRR